VLSLPVARIVNTHYHYKRPPRKRKAVALDVPVVAKAGKPKPRKASAASQGPAIVTSRLPADQKTIVTPRKPSGRSGNSTHLTPEEHQRRGNAADALFRELVRRAAGNDR
jgi:hypothetical protein